MSVRIKVFAKSIAAGCCRRQGGADIVIVLETLLLVLILVSAAGILLSNRIQVATGMYMLFSLLLAILWGMLYGARLAITEIGVGVVVTGLLLYVAMRKLREKKGPQDESKT